MLSPIVGDHPSTESGLAATQVVKSSYPSANTVAPTNIPRIPPLAMPPRAPKSITGIGISTPRPNISGFRTLSARPVSRRMMVCTIAAVVLYWPPALKSGLLLRNCLHEFYAVSFYVRQGWLTTVTFDSFVVSHKPEPQEFYNSLTTFQDDPFL